MPDRQTAAEFVARLRRLRSVADVERVARFYRVDPDASVPDAGLCPYCSSGGERGRIRAGDECHEICADCEAIQP